VRFGPNTLISLEFNGQIDAFAYQVLRIFEGNFDAVAILHFDQVNWPRFGSPTQSLGERAAKRIVGLRRISYAEALAAQNPDIRGILSPVAAPKKASFLQCSQEPETDCALNARLLCDFAQGKHLPVILESLQDTARTGDTFQRVRRGGRFLISGHGEQIITSVGAKSVAKSEI